MKNTYSIITENTNDNKSAFAFIKIFFENIGLTTIFKETGFYKQTGIPVLRVFQTIFNLIFTHKNWWRTCKDSKNPDDIKKDVIYRFLNNGFYKWEELLLKLAVKVIIMIKKLTSSKRKCALVFDDTFFDRMRSKSVELLSWVFDHVTVKNKKGFLNLTAGWTDGASFIPFIFHLVSSPKNIVKKFNPGTPGSVAATRRENALRKKTDLMIEMIAKAKEYKIPFNYALFDSWFAFPVIFIKCWLLKTKAIAMLKDHPKIFYTYKGKSYRLSRLYSKIKKNLKKDRDRFSVITSISAMGITLDVKVLFIRDKRSRRNWVALLSTDIDLTDDEIIKIYGMRWEIEVFFKMCKTYLKFAKEFQGRSFDMLVAHTVIVYIRFIMFAFTSRFNTDEKSFGDMFFHCCDEAKTISFWKAFKLILDLLKQFLVDKLTIAAEVIAQLLDEFVSTLPPDLFQNLTGKKCES